MKRPRREHLEPYLEPDPTPTSKSRTTPLNRQAIVKKFCLYQGDVDKLRKLCGGEPRKESVVIRYLIRQCKGIDPMEIVMSEADGMRRQIERAVTYNLKRVSPEREGGFEE